MAESDITVKCVRGLRVEASPVELPKATAAMVPWRKSSGGLQMRMINQPKKAPMLAYITGKKNIGHTRRIRCVLIAGSTLVKSSAGMVTLIESIDKAFVTSFVITPVLPM